MDSVIGSIVQIKITDVKGYGVIGVYENLKIYVDLVDLSWKSPVPSNSIPNAGDEIQVFIFDKSKRHDSDYIASVKYFFQEENPWYNPAVYKIGSEFIGVVDSVESFGCWALHPKGASARILVDGIKLGLKKGQKIKLRITSVNEQKKNIDVVIIN